MKPDPCVTLPGLGTVCGQDAVGACEKFPSIPGCGTVCSLFGCKKQDTPNTLCPPNWRVATGSGFRGQCCKGETDSDSACCPPDRIAWADGRCCGAGEVVSADRHCAPSTAPPFRPLPEQPDLTEKFCKDFPNLCKPQPGPPEPVAPMTQFGVLWTDQIHFEQDQPGGGAGGSVLTPEGARELEIGAVLAAHLARHRDTPDRQRFLRGAKGERRGVQSGARRAASRLCAESPGRVRIARRRPDPRRRRRERIASGSAPDSGHAGRRMRRLALPAQRIASCGSPSPATSSPCHRSSWKCRAAHRHGSDRSCADRPPGRPWQPAFTHCCKWSCIAGQ